MTQENKINIAELLKDCPSGMELDCILYDNIYFDTVEHNSIMCYIQNKGYRTSVTFNVYGGLIDSIPTKCVIFPKGKTTWEGFVPPCHFKDGDVLISVHDKPFILKKIHNNKICESYCGIRQNGEFVIESHNWTSNYNLRLATEEEKQKLFQTIKDNGYKWNEETKTLEKLPKFKVGDRVKKKDSNEDVVGLITEITDNYYVVETKYGMEVTISIDIQNNYELVPSKFDITTLKPFAKVLVRDSDKGMWCASIFSHTWEDKYFCIGTWYNQCIPYEAYKELLGTTNNPKEHGSN